MGVRSIIVTLLASSLFACGGASQTEAKGPEGNPWADYKGTYATAAEPKAAKTEVAKSDVPVEAPVEETLEEAPAAPPPPAKKGKSAPKKKKRK